MRQNVLRRITPDIPVFSNISGFIKKTESVPADQKYGTLWGGTTIRHQRMTLLSRH